MASSYPTAIDTGLVTTRASGNIIPASDHNDLADAVKNVETELGTNPRGAYASVAARLTADAAAIAALQSASAGATPTIASAATVTLPADSVIKISGTTTITSITAGAAGRRVTLIFTGVLTLVDGSNLKLAGNFVTAVDDAITLVSDGTNWYEA